MISETNKRKVHEPEFKAKVSLEAVGGVKTISEIAQESGIHLVLADQLNNKVLESSRAAGSKKG